MSAQQQAIDYFSSHHPLRWLASKVSYRSRKLMFDLFLEIVRPDSESKVVDVGVTPDEKLMESNFFETFYPYSHNITATSIEDASFLEQKFPGLQFVRTGPERLPFDDKQFDVAVSFAVLEHVGNSESQRKFIEELLRIAELVFLTTPNRGFPIEVHTFLPIVHWLPRQHHQAILKAFGMHFWSRTQNLNLVDKAALRQLFPADAQLEIRSSKLLGMSSNLIAIASQNTRESIK